MKDSTSPPSSILVDLDLPDPEPLAGELIRILSSLRVVLLGWFSVPEQTTPAQARDQFGAESEATLDEVAQRFEAAGTEVTTRLVFTGDEFDTISRVSVEEQCDAVLIPGSVDALRRVLVPLRGMHNVRQIAPFVADLCQDREADVTLLHILEDEETAASSRETVLEPASRKMSEYGIDVRHFELESVAADDPADTIVEWADDHDLVVLGETKPSVREILFGTVPERIVTVTDTPVIVVRHEDEKVDAAEQATQAGSS